MDVYVDLLFLVNFVLNGWAIWLSSSLVVQKLPWSRLCLASALGAIYGLGLVTPWAAFFSHPLCKLVLALAMVQIAFRPRLVVKLLQLGGLFLLVSFATAGCVLGIRSLWSEGLAEGGRLAYGELPLWTLLLAVLLLAIGSHKVLGLLGQRLLHVVNRASISFRLNDREVVLTGLVDSGNHLSDPFGGRPVVVVSLEAIADLLPPELVALSCSAEPYGQALEGLSGQPWVDRVRFIPYHSVGQRAGVLTGWRVDQANVITEHGSRTTTNVVLAVTDQRLSQMDEYQALIPERLVPTVTKSTEEVPR